MGVRRKGAAVVTRLVAGIVAIFLAAGVGQGQERITPEIGKQVQDGKGKLTEQEVLKLVPGPVTVERNTSGVEGDLVLSWEEVCRIRVEFTEGKVTSAIGTFANAVASRTLTLENFKKIAKGMSRGDVEKLLERRPGEKGSFSLKSLPDNSGRRTKAVCEWEQGRKIIAYIKDGKVVGSIYTDSTGE
jgi:hypothetical protein